MVGVNPGQNSARICPECTTLISRRRIAFEKSLNHIAIAEAGYFCLVVLLGVIHADYYTPSEEVGRELAKYDRENDERYPFEYGLGYYYQGDIMLVPPEDARVSIPDSLTSYIWPNGTVPYEIAGNFSRSELRTIRNAMNMFRRYTCVRFVKKTDDDDFFVTIVNNNTGCYSYVGRQSNNDFNLINLQTPVCLMAVGTPVHEMMHAIGFYHEFVRPDRDEYIYINRSALLPELQTDEVYNDNFAKLQPQDGQTYNISYNYGSVMHYSRYAGARSREYPTLINKKPYVGDFGNENGFALTDVMEINLRYKCINRDRIPKPSTSFFQTM
ncbi:astacin-like [Toxorhynchites rutilus septentrionalis]|uniref:astacin-like n=1 Tax=Toxorhynchites rutilus septentrionalis TaxID=329112 RepID=UPI00247A1D5D|nr:astacin-like [Toxorhynchites rutilus septentrionalis]